MTRFAEKQCCISGIGQSEIFRKPQILPFELAVRACERAIADAGLKRSQIDGLAVWPTTPPGSAFGFAAASIADITASLDLQPTWHSDGSMAAQLSPVMEAVAAIAAGYANHVLCWRSVGQRWKSSALSPLDAARMESPPAGFLEWLLPYQAPSAAQWTGCFANTHMTRYGITKEQLGAIPIAQRRHAGLNPQAIYREPFGMEEYLAARIVSTPLSLLDCDVPCDGATAVIVSRLDSARELAKPPIVIEAISAGFGERPDSWIANPNYPRMAMHDAAARMWARTDLKPGDVDTAHLYDGFSWLTLSWLEALGFCGEGESGAFVDGGQRISLGGELPLNTNGGQLSEGRMHGFGFIHEAVLQLRREAGARQVEGAEVSVIGSGGGSLGGAMLLRRC